MAAKKKSSDLPSKAKAKRMLEDNQANGRPLTKKQKHLFGMIAGGKKVTRTPKK